MNMPDFANDLLRDIARSQRQVATKKTRCDAVQPGMILRSSHGYRLLITEVRDDAAVRSEDRAVYLTGHLHAKTSCALAREVHDASAAVEVESDAPAWVANFRAAREHDEPLEGGDDCGDQVEV